MKQDLVREAATTMDHGMQTADPQITRVGPTTGVTSAGAENIMPARITRTKVAAGSRRRAKPPMALGTTGFKKPK